MKKLLLFLLSICFSIVLQAQVTKTIHLIKAGTLSDSIKYSTSFTKLVVTGVIDSSDFTILKTLSSYPIIIDISGTNCKRIPLNAFLFCKKVTTIILPSSLTSIGYGAFRGCRNLTITIPATVSFIDIGAFRECGYITVNANNLNYSSENGVLYNKTMTKLISFPTSRIGNDDIIPNSVTIVGQYAFDLDSNLTSIILPSSVTTIENYAFSGCKGLTSIILSPSLVSIGFNVFSDCISLTSIIIPSTVNFIGFAAFSGCKGLTSITIPTSVTSIGNSAFHNCISLKSVSFDNPSSVRSIEANTFNNDSNLISITIPSSVTSIGSYAFNNCFRLKTVSIPSSVDTLMMGAFRFCNSLSAIYSYDNIPVNLTDIVFYGVDPATCILYVPFGTKSAYQTANQWKDFDSIEEMNGLILSDTSITLSNIANSSSITVSSNINWTAVSDQSWLSIAQSVSSGNGIITINITEANPTILARKATITINTSSGLQKITVIQAGESPIINVSNTTASVSATLNSISTVNISSNTSWTASTTSSWLTVTQSVSTGNGTVTFTTNEANPTKIARTAMVTIQTSSGLQTIKVTQEAGTGTGFNDVEFKKASFFPNPTTDLFQVKNINGIANISIYDINGTLYLKQPVTNEEVVNIKSLPKGLYTINLQDSNGIYNCKLIKQ